MQSYETFYYFFNSFLFVRKSNKRKKINKNMKKTIRFIKQKADRIIFIAVATATAFLSYFSILNLFVTKNEIWAVVFAFAIALSYICIFATLQE